MTHQKRQSTCCAIYSENYDEILTEKSKNFFNSIYFSNKSKEFNYSENNNNYNLAFQISQLHDDDTKTNAKRKSSKTEFENRTKMQTTNSNLEKKVNEKLLNEFTSNEK